MAGGFRCLPLLPTLTRCYVTVSSDIVDSQKVVAESTYYKGFWVLVSLALAAFGGWLMYPVGTDFASEGSVGVFGFGAVMCVAGFATTAIGIERLHT